MTETGWSPYEEVDHTADLALRVRGRDLAEVFVHAAQGMFHLMRCAPQGDPEPVSHVVVLDSVDREALLVDWLNELLYLSEGLQECYRQYEITRLDATHLEAQVGGWIHHPCGRGIKAATFSGLGIQAVADGLEATITFDV